MANEVVPTADGAQDLGADVKRWGAVKALAFFQNSVAFGNVVFKNAATVIGTPGSDANVATEKAVRDAITSVPSGVTSWNSRTLAVMPQLGDYTANMVGADAAGAATSAIGTHESTWNHATIQNNAVIGANHAAIVTGNPHNVTKNDISLNNVTNDAQVKRTEMATANGVATLDANGTVPTSQLPASTSAIWGNITGTLANQNDLQSALNNKCSNTDVRLSDARTPVGTALTQNYIYIGGVTNLAAAVNVTGDMSIIANGTVTITANSVTFPKLSTDAVGSGANQVAVGNHTHAGMVTAVTASVPLLSTGGATPNLALGTVVAPTTSDSNADVIWGTSATTKKGLVLQAKAAQTANLFCTQLSAGTTVSGFNAAGEIFAQRGSGTDNFFTATAAAGLASGGDNICIGRIAGNVLNAGANNVLIGATAGSLLTDSYSVYVGYQAGTNQTAGSNTFLGAQAGKGSASSTASAQTAVGYQALYVVATGAARNTAMGNTAANALTTGDDNVAIGDSAGKALTTASQCTFLGSAADLVSTQYGNAGAIGYNAKVDQADSFVIGQTGASAPLLGLNTTQPGAQIHAVCRSASTIGQIVQAASAQTANIKEYRSSAGAVLSGIDAIGQRIFAVTDAAGTTPVDTDVSAWANNSMGIVKGTGGRIFQAFKNATDVYYVEMTAI